MTTLQQRIQAIKDTMRERGYSSMSFLDNGYLHTASLAHDAQGTYFIVEDSNAKLIHKELIA